MVYNPLPWRIANAIVSYVTYLRQLSGLWILQFFILILKAACRSGRFAAACPVLAGITTGRLGLATEVSVSVGRLVLVSGHVSAVIGLLQVGRQADGRSLTRICLRLDWWLHWFGALRTLPGRGPIVAGRAAPVLCS